MLGGMPGLRLEWAVSQTTLPSRSKPFSKSSDLFDLISRRTPRVSVEAHGDARGGYYNFRNTISGHNSCLGALARSGWNIAQCGGLELCRPTIGRHSIPSAQNHNDCAVEHVRGRPPGIKSGCGIAR